MDASVGDKPWLKSYPPGVPEQLPPLEFESIPRMLEAAVARLGYRLVKVDAEKA